MRRFGFATLALGLSGLLLLLGVRVMAPGGWSVWEMLLFLCLALNAPWIALAGATGLVGLLLRLRGRTPVPIPQAPPMLRTAIAVCVRDEAMDAVLPPLARLLDGLAAHGDRFALAILSDTTDPARAKAEQAVVDAFVKTGRAVRYRRRSDNAGYKAGNVMDFLDHHADGFDLMLLLDADSEMTPAAVLQMVHAMQADAKLAILQAPVSGRPAAASFGRLFNVGHRAGVQTWILGQDWWQGAQGPFWGHNAVLRVAPFRQHCRLGLLPDGTHILSHDHVEAARLHAAGWGVRVFPDLAADGSLESPPPDLLAYLARDSRWAAGNLQYRSLLRDRSLSRVGRFQMLQAILHYVLAPSWFAMLPLAALNAALDAEGTPRGALLALLLLGYGLLHLPRLGGHAAALWQGPPEGRAAYLKLALSEAVFLLLFDPIIAFHKTKVVLSHLLGLSQDGWPAQRRAETPVPWREAATLLWPHSLAGLLVLGLLFSSGSGFALLLGLPAAAGLVLAIPFAVLTAARPQVK
ncbi:glucans biosynthesis glucosyltransferase MdoH [Roseomonas haemaphysalidis]|uniref:Glucans biosynthesis glucosyltransferase H n=1 Tax=Roseomonas haemaphysalidis TaxID=2768162 RepID=A0ABS3KK19_9PROT|nr:glucans biosynthesis glucosyltransferase MdoH [Roseomonas haemaphysalidis]MBO1077812.1 glucans biosynthesis glucosyltransferase MdoH [Roseomonas haemaphysalidis]